MLTFQKYIYNSKYKMIKKTTMRSSMKIMTMALSYLLGTKVVWDAFVQLWLE